MKFTLSWLKEHLDTDASVDEITYALTDLGLEVDCSIGGMNGADTSLYALSMCKKYQRFVCSKVGWDKRICFHH